ncbi:MAG: SGNH/GDSL hydrolase family protein [Armatimonadota bacterium]|nr:SGNH/GDSL hydrolase family protein [Armatimonadota bacterium]
MRTIWLVLALLAFGIAARANQVLGVNSPAVRFSPGNWAGDTGRGGSIRRTTWNNGAWCAWTWTTTSDAPTATLHITNQTPGSAVSYFLDGALADNVAVPAQGGIALAGLSGSGQHMLIVYMRNSVQKDRWSGKNAFTVTGLTVDDGARPLPAAPARPWALIVGDSITEGIQADNGRDSALSDYSFLVGQGLMAAGYDYGVSACGYSGWIRPGDAGGDVPAYFAVRNGVPSDADSRWDKIDAHTPLLDAQGHLSAYGRLGQEPALILINYATNEALSGASLTEMRQSVTLCLAALRRAAPNARIVVLVPPGLADRRIYARGSEAITALKDGVTAYQTAHRADARVALLDLGPLVAHALASPAYGGGVHPNAAGHAYLAPLVLQGLIVAMSAK